MENQKKLLDLFVQYIRENQRTVEKLAEMANENDRSFARRLTSRGELILREIENITQTPNPPKPNI